MERTKLFQWIPIILLAIALIISVIGLFTNRPPLDSYVLFYPTATGDNFIGEKRSLPRSDESNPSAARLVESYLFGPRDLNLVLPTSDVPRLQTVIYHSESIHIGFEPSSLLTIEGEELDRLLFGIERTILHNLPAAGAVHFYGGEQEIGSRPYLNNIQ